MISILSSDDPAFHILCFTSLLSFFLVKINLFSHFYTFFFSTVSHVDVKKMKIWKYRGYKKHASVISTQNIKTSLLQSMKKHKNISSEIYLKL
jgi:hypothetical protein